MAQFVAKGHDYFACLAGTVRIDNDFAQVDKLWNKHVEAWFPGGKDDPNLALLRFDIDSAELWEADMSVAGMVKMLFPLWLADAHNAGAALLLLVVVALNFLAWRKTA